MKRPAFQFYPADWRNNAKLRRCSEAARGAWMDMLCALHDSDEYGVVRWPLADLARAAGVSLKLARELVEKDVLKGGDKGCAPYIYTPVSGRIAGPPVVLVEAEAGAPCWYSSRLVRDEYVRQRRGNAAQFARPGPRAGEAPASSGNDAGNNAGKPSSELAAELRRLGVSVTPAHPLLLQWLQDGYTHGQIYAALETARLSKPPPAAMPAKYLDTVLRSPPSRKARSRPPEPVPSAVPAEREQGRLRVAAMKQALARVGGT